MQKNYNLSHRLIACILFVGLFLQSCGGFSNRVIPQEKWQPSITLELSDNPLINTDKKIVTSGGYLASFYEEDGALKADLRADEKQPEPNYKGLSVAIEEGADLAAFLRLDQKIQQRRIQFQTPQNGRTGHISILKKGRVLGGMKKSDEGKKKNDKDKEKEDERENQPEPNLKQFIKQEEKKKEIEEILDQYQSQKVKKASLLRKALCLALKHNYDEISKRIIYEMCPAKRLVELVANVIRVAVKDKDWEILNNLKETLKDSNTFNEAYKLFGRWHIAKLQEITLGNEGDKSSVLEDLSPCEDDGFLDHLETTLSEAMVRSYQALKEGLDKATELQGEKEQQEVEQKILNLFKEDLIPNINNALQWIVEIAEIPQIAELLPQDFLINSLKGYLNAIIETTTQDQITDFENELLLLEKILKIEKKEDSFLGLPAELGYKIVAYLLSSEETNTLSEVGPCWNYFIKDHTTPHFLEGY